MSTYVERIFKYLINWSKEPQGVETVAAKHVYTSFKGATTRWREQNEFGSLESPAKSRPPWTKTANPGVSVTGLHLFQRGRSKDEIISGLVKQEWKDAPEALRVDFRTRAMSRRHLD